MKTLRFITSVFICIFALIYFLYISYIYINQGEMVFLASKLDKNFKFEFDNDYEEITISSFDSIKLHGILFKSVNAKGLIFYLHGNAGALNTWGNISKTYTDLGYDIFILDYRGFGKSEGAYENENQVNQDIQIVYNTFLKKYPEEQIVVLGYSIGTGPATYLTSKNKPKQLILLAPYFNFREFSESRVPFFPDFLKKFNFETNNFISVIKAPISIFHGDKDQLINFKNSVRLQKIIKPTDSLYILENQGHIGINENEDFNEKLKVVL